MQHTSVFRSYANMRGQSYFWRRVEEAKKWVPNSQVDGTPETPRIKLKMSTTIPPIAAGSAMKVVEQSSGMMSKVDGESSDMIAKHKPPGPQREVFVAGSASQEASDSPRRHLNRSRPNLTTMSASEPSEPSLVSNSAKNETPASISMSQDYPHVALEASVDVTQNHSLCKLRFQIFLAVSFNSFTSFTNPFSANASFHQLSNPSPMDSLLRRPDQGTSVCV